MGEKGKGRREMRGEEEGRPLAPLARFERAILSPCSFICCASAKAPSSNSLLSSPFPFPPFSFSLPYNVSIFQRVASFLTARLRINHLACLPA
jgi:hypothetical protein